MAALQGVGVLVTRPEQQSMPLCRLLEAEGAKTLRFPAIEIRAAADRREATARVGALENFDVIIFTSANAVRFGAALLEQRRGFCLAALGPATARALNQAGYRVAIQPTDAVDSEALLRHPALQRPVGRRILIVKGVDGRPTLADKLSQDGAQVASLDVYQRLAARPDPAALTQLHEKLAADEVQVVTATSVDIASNLLAIVGNALRGELGRLPWLVPGARVADAVRTLGVTAPLIEATSAEDQVLVAALVAWRTESGA
jgi:uroporphyrinogen-III synthase